MFRYIRIPFCVCVLALNTFINTQKIRFWKCFFSYSMYIMLCMHFCVWYLTIWNTLKTYGFSNFYPFLHIECYLCVLGFWYLRSWKIFIIHVSLNVLYYPDIGYIACILAFSVRDKRKHKTWKYLFLVMLFGFSINRVFTSIIAFWYVGTLEILKEKRFW